MNDRTSIRARTHASGQSGLIRARDAPIRETLSAAEVIECLAPLGAPALMLYGTVLPLTGALANMSLRERWENRGRGYVDLVLQNFPDYDEPTRRRLGDLLEGPRRRDRLPAYWPGHPCRDAGWIRAVNRGYIGRALFTTVGADLKGNPLTRFGGDVVSPDLFVKDPREARKYRTRGRLLLHRLGAWPWAHAEKGRLPYGWNGQPRWPEPFAAELEQWRVRALNELHESYWLARTAPTSFSKSR